MKRMRRRRRDFRVAACRREAAARDRRRVVAMDDVVRHSGMVRLLGEYLFEDRARLELVGVGLVGRGRGGVQSERVEDRRLMVVRIARVQTLHRLFVRNGSSAMITLVPVAIEGVDGREIISLSL